MRKKENFFLIFFIKIGKQVCFRFQTGKSKGIFEYCDVLGSLLVKLQRIFNYARAVYLVLCEALNCMLSTVKSLWRTGYILFKTSP
jgi:hypothetical protein